MSVLNTLLMKLGCLSVYLRCVSIIRAPVPLERSYFMFQNRFLSTSLGSAIAVELVQ